MDEKYSVFWDSEKEVVLPDSIRMWITGMKEELFKVYDEQHQVLTVFFNAYPPMGHEKDMGVDEWNQKHYGKDYYGNDL